MSTATPILRGSVWFGAIASAMLLSAAPAFTHAAGTPSEDNMILRLSDPADTCVQPGETVSVVLSMSDLSEPVNGYQAFLSFEPAALTFVTGNYTLSPFPFAILPIVVSSGNHLDLSAGVIPGNPPVQVDADLAVLQFTANGIEGSTTVVFRDNQPPTQFTTDDGGALMPTLFDSPRIVITSSTDDADADGTPDPCDRCPCSDDSADADADGIPDGCDMFGDYDHDGDVDLDDYQEFPNCLNGPLGVSEAACAVFDADDDEDVDLADFAEFQIVFGRSTCG